MAGTTCAPGTSAASASSAAATTTRVHPAATAATTAGSTPRTGRTRPSSPSSPRWTVRAASSASGHAPAPTMVATAMPRSNPDPAFGSAAGDRFTVIRRVGHGSPLEVDRRTHPVAGLAQRRVGQPDQGEPGQLRGQVRLDLDEVPAEPDERHPERPAQAHSTPRRCSKRASPPRSVRTATTSTRTAPAWTSCSVSHCPASRRSRASLRGGHGLGGVPERRRRCGS